jgi:hypothetical protein
MTRFILFLNSFLILCSSIQSQDLKLGDIQKLIDDIVISKNFQGNIKMILPLVDNIQVVVVEIGYREYPGILLIKKDSKTNTWKRSFECLSPGIQEKPSGLLDWHTKGLGVDFIAGRDSIYTFDSKIIQSLIESSIKRKGSVIIPYQNFIHMNTSDSKVQKKFTPYTIDKTHYLDFANSLTNNKYKSYPSKECIMFDTPKIVDCKFFKEKNKYKISVNTDNNQTWNYEFDDIDSNFKYLINKKIEVSNSR